jgi:hypothetical protein
MRFLNLMMIALLVVMVSGIAACNNAEPPQDTSQAGNGETSTQPDPANDISGAETESVVTPDSTDGVTHTDTAVEGDDTTTGMEAPDLTNLIETEDLPERWPEYIPVMDGLTCIQGVDALDVPDQSGIMAVFEGDVPMLEVAEFYSNLEGWQKDESFEMPPAGEDGFYMILFRDDDKVLQAEGGLYEDGKTGVRLIMIVGDLEAMQAEAE